MILYGGKIYENKEQDRLLTELEPRAARTLAEKTLSTDSVISAIDALGRELAAGKYDDMLLSLQTDDPLRYKALGAALLSRENLEYKIKTELSETEFTTSPPCGLKKIKVKTLPLGVLFHIAAGNMDGLPAFSLAEGLITGNVNILKLPQADNGLSLKIISRLIELEPQLSDYIYVFDTPSTDIEAMRKMSLIADGISVWGGDTAVAAVRALAPQGVKLIEWGHKLGFCYISGYEQEELFALAEHIAATKQALCSSCQTIFIDTDNMDEIHTFCKTFLPILEKSADRHKPDSIGTRAYLTLIRETERLERIAYPKSGLGEYIGKRCGLLACEESELELSPMMCRVLVKRLPQKDIPSVLRRKKGYLQTAGLVCSPEKREQLTELLARCGVNRITTAGNMSEFFSGEAHDGEYPLRRYVRTVNIE